MGTMPSPMREYRSHVSGPEERIRRAIAEQPELLFDTNPHSLWKAGSFRVGAGMPDVIFARFDSSETTVMASDLPHVDVLTYLRSVRCATTGVVAARLNRPEGQISRTVADLSDVSAVTEMGGAWKLTRPWREGITEIVSVEAKVSYWQKALAQANRNLLFSNRSYIALPEGVAMRIAQRQEIKSARVGLISVDDVGHAKILKPALVGSPKIWTYYYRVAIEASRG